MKPDHTPARNLRPDCPGAGIAPLLAAVGLLFSALGVPVLAQDRPSPGSSRPSQPPGPAPQPDPSRPGVRNPPGTAPKILPRTVITPGGQPVVPGTKPSGAAAATKPGTTVTHAQPPEPPPASDGQAPSPDDDITLSAFTDAVDLTALVEYVAKALGVNVTVSGSLTGSVVFNAPVTIKRHQLLNLLDALLEQQSYTITLDPEGFYIVHPMDKVSFNLGSDLPTTKIIPTPNIRPSALKAAIDSQISGGTGAPGQVQPGIVTASKGFAYIDELGIIVVTDTPRRIAAVEALVNRIIEEYGKAEFTRIELQYIAAPVARARALELVGQSVGNNQPTIDPNTGAVLQPGQGGAFGQGSKGLDNLGERLTVDPLGNALIFRGHPGEADMLGKFLKIIDAQSTLSPKSYNAGSAAKQVADIARDRGLGQVTLIAAKELQDPNNPYRFAFNNGEQQPQQNKQNLNGGGPVMVVDEERGTIIYYGTKEQQTELQSLIDQFKVEDEFVTIIPYKLRHSDATKVAELILGLIQNTTPTGTSSLLPGSDGTGPGSAGSTFGGARRNNTNRSTFRAQGGSADQPGTSISDDERIFVIADTSNNQILVKAPVKDQPDFEKLIGKLDQRRPQVYIEAKIVAVTATDEFRLAFETQLINANGTGGVLNTNFGISAFPTPGELTTRKNVSTGLTGFTAALIKSDQVPIAITALQRDSDTRILSTPQLLVDDNEEAKLASVDEQPTTSTQSSTGNPNITSFQGYEKAGTEFTVKPQISSGGYLRLKYSVSLSSFTGTGSAGVPPPKSTNEISSDSVTVPSDTTVVVGGLVLDTKGKTVVKVPLIGDIPIIGSLFSDTNTNDRKTTLYIFLTPKIIRDPNFDDLTLLTRGPMKAVNVDDGVPTIKPTFIEIIEPKTDLKLESKSDVKVETVPLPPSGG